MLFIPSPGPYFYAKYINQSNLYTRKILRKLKERGRYTKNTIRHFPGEKYKITEVVSNYFPSVGLKIIVD